ASAHEKNIRQSVVVQIHDTGAPAYVAGLYADTGSASYVFEVGFAIVAIQTVRVFAEMRLEQIDVAVEIVIADADSHPGLFLAVFAKGHAAHDAFLAKCPIVIVHEQQARRGIAGDVNVGPTILVEVGGDRGHAITATLRSDARCGADISECAVAVVAVEGMDSARQTAGSAFDGNSLPGAIDVCSRLGNAV